MSKKKSKWLKKFDKRTKAYYQSMTKEEREDQRRWAIFATSQFFAVQSREQRKLPNIAKHGGR